VRSIPPQSRSALLTLHRTLIERERRNYEKIHGRVSDGDFLQGLIHDPAFAWLAPLTTLMVRLEALEDEGKGDEVGATVAAIRELLSLQPERSEFHRRYRQAVDDDPDVAVAHGIVLTQLRRFRPEQD
jgi:hypothetical protein